MDATGTKGSLKDLQRIVGEEHAREATAEDAVGGLTPFFVAEPGSLEETSELMKLASSEGLSVAPRGGGTKMHLGNPPRELDLIVSTARLNEVIEHTPEDQVVRVQTGIKLETLQEHYIQENYSAEKKQMMGMPATPPAPVDLSKEKPREANEGAFGVLTSGRTLIPLFAVALFFGAFYFFRKDNVLNTC